MTPPPKGPPVKKTLIIPSSSRRDLIIAVGAGLAVLALVIFMMVSMSKVPGSPSTNNGNLARDNNTGASTYPTGLGQFPAGNATNGFDDDSNGIVDDVNEQITSPPYPAPLRGIQVKIRVFEPDSRQVREVTVEQDFLPK